MLRFAMHQTERCGLPDGAPWDRLRETAAVRPLSIYVWGFRLNPGNTGVHVSFLRQEINERNRERRRGYCRDECQTGSGVFKIRVLFVKGTGEQFYHRGRDFSVFSFMSGMTSITTVLYSTMSPMKKIELKYIDSKTLTCVREDSCVRI